MPHFYLEGYNLVGALCAWELDSHNISFTWGASGYPEAATFPALVSNADNLAVVRSWIFEQHAISSFCERTELLSGADRLPAVAIDVLGFIDATKKRFATKIATRSEEDIIIAAHGFNNLVTHYLWYWSGFAQCQPPSRMSIQFGQYSGQQQYGYRMAYILPRSNLWQVGTDLVCQKHIKPLDAAGYIAKWMRDIRVMSKVLDVETITRHFDGWLPCTRKLECTKSPIEGEGGIWFPPLGTYLVQYAPLLIRQLMPLVKRY